MHLPFFDGVDRDYNNGDVVAQIEELITIKPELVTVNGTDYFEFTTASFSPFVLAYAVETEEPEPSTEPSPSPTTEPTPAPTTEPTAEPTPRTDCGAYGCRNADPGSRGHARTGRDAHAAAEKPAVDTPQTGDSTNPGYVGCHPVHRCRVPDSLSRIFPHAEKSEPQGSNPHRHTD